MGKSLTTKLGLGPRATHVYKLSGLRTHSQIPLTGVPISVNDSGDPDVMIEVATGRSPIAESTSAFQHTTECSLIKIEDVGDFEIRWGRQVRIWPVEGVTKKDIEIFLLGPAWAALCHQRGLLPLHASAIVTGKGITAFAGHSGAGKSTTAALLNSLGYELIADDILPVSFDENLTPGAWPYLRRLKLHHGPIIQLGFTPTEMVSETLDKEKYFVHPKCTGNDKWMRLERLYLLENDVTESRTPVEQIIGADAVRALVDNTYQFKFIVDTRRFADHLEFCTRLASKILIYRLRLPPLSNPINKVGSLICAHLEGEV